MTLLRLVLAVTLTAGVLIRRTLHAANAVCDRAVIDDPARHVVEQFGRSFGMVRHVEHAILVALPLAEGGMVGAVLYWVQPQWSLVALALSIAFASVVFWVGRRHREVAPDPETVLWHLPLSAEARDEIVELLVGLTRPARLSYHAKNLAVLIAMMISVGEAVVAVAPKPGASAGCDKPEKVSA